MAQKKWIQSLSVLEVQPQQASISAAASGDNVILPAVTGKKLCVLGVCLIAAGAVNARIYSGASAGNKPRSGSLPLAANGGFVLPAPVNAEMHWLETDAGEGLVLNLSAAVAVGGVIIYYEL